MLLFIFWKNHADDTPEPRTLESQGGLAFDLDKLVYAFSIALFGTH